METSEEILIGLGVLVVGYLGYQYIQNMPATNPIAGSSLIPASSASSAGSPSTASTVGQAIASAVAQVTQPSASVAPVTAVSAVAATISQDDLEASAYDVMQTFRTGNNFLVSVGTWNAGRASYGALHGNVNVRLATGDPYGWGSKPINGYDYHGWLRNVGAE